MRRFNELESLLTQGKITPREFTEKVSALGLAAAVSPMLWKGVAHASAPKRGGGLRIGLAGGSTSGSLDPDTITDMMPQVVNCTLKCRRW